MPELSILLDRSVIIALAVIGAVVATFGSHISRRPATRAAARRARLWLGAGYGITAASVVLFIIAGFASGR
jgi:hypothetical protein